MATLSNLTRENIGRRTPLLYDRLRSTIETAFYKNNVIKINSLDEAYNLAKKSPGAIITDLNIYKPEEFGLSVDSKVIIFNDGYRTGRTAAARKIMGTMNIDRENYSTIVREAIYKTNNKKMYWATCLVGLHKDFMVRAHILVPEGYENILYSWMLNFQVIDDIWSDQYKDSKLYNEGDIFVFSDPDWVDDDHPDGLTLFDSEHNCAALLGMRYFGEHKKGTLTLSWAIASRNGYTACHGGQKRYNLPNGNKYIAGVFGLSGSGKSTISHSTHNGDYNITVLHDDSFIISTKDGSSIALEPSYFDKTQDYPTSSSDNKYLLTMQNCGVTIDDSNNVVPVTEDIRNGNGRAIKSSLWSPERVYKFNEKCNAIFWIMKDESLPPVIKIKSPILASSFGATLATRRTTAEHLRKGEDDSKLVIEPYANPFRTYPLVVDYKNFKSLFKEMNVDCYVLNTGYFLHRKINKEVTLGIIDKIFNNKAKFIKFGHIKDVEYMEIKHFKPNFNDKSYVKLLYNRIQRRIDYVNSLRDINRLPSEVSTSLLKVLEEIRSPSIV